MLKTLFLWLFIAIIIITVINNFGPRHPGVSTYSYSQFLSAVDKGTVKSVVIDDQTIQGETIKQHINIVASLWNKVLMKKI